MRRQDAPLREAYISYICAGLLNALDYMHTEVKAIHRDIKAANVLLTADASVKLADLGVAAQLYNTMSKRGTMIGTPHWMAPETLGQNEQYDKKARSLETRTRTPARARARALTPARALTRARALTLTLALTLPR